jgi:hypothetical protein
MAPFFATAAFPGGTALAATKMGALLSVVAAPIAVGARLVRTSFRRPSLEAAIPMKPERG